MRVPNLYGLLSVGHLLAALRSLFATSRDDSVPLIMELLSLSACPAGVLLLLRLAAAGSLAASGASLALAHDAVYTFTSYLVLGDIATIRSFAQQLRPGSRA